MTVYTIDQLAQMIDHTNLKPYADGTTMKKLCDEARQYHFKMVAINSVQTALCKTFLQGTDIHVGAAISFPLGQTTIETKAFETSDAIEDGADEIDYVVNLSELKNKNYRYIEKEMETIVGICKQEGVISKVIFENCYLEKHEIEMLARIAKKVKPDFIKTSTGFGTGGANIDDVRLMKEIVGDEIKVKAAGGIRDAETFLAMIEAGAERIGTSSGVQIINSLQEKAENGIITIG
ncbi:deoxyribose-phosphate aldolase [Weizmannia acidilactici]|uniref:Deoxyribose-phosphate aldolase n=1 Tax=Weizmannia acidilactici TaxID=2607726 RepID=A0A5J4JEG8_9BACI|nr:deoxyribose-phosphate aldolase [Weizmannia acidilactici]GER67355.1 deoxyribose-phosphate aldolase [Weizmannia acidilactici]GER70071.1 deoxyribose-phosphate aldolase [Weizmannia acidilactici]GER74261.1 deoxyribose-phosphate aldolase [Weizmannia acidilactici]